MQIPDPAQLAAQGRVIDAQKEIAAMQLAQNVRQEKAKNAINLILLPLQKADGVIRQEPEYDDPEVRPRVVAARCAAYKFLEDYFSTTTDLEAGIPVREVTAVDSPVLSA